MDTEHRPRWDEGYLTVSDGVKIHYYLHGQGTPVVLIHGYAGTARGNWISNGIFDALATQHRVVALDCRNHGFSDKPTPQGPGKADDVIELMDHLDMPRAHIHGYSMGGWLTSQLLGKIPGRFLSAGFGGSGIPETDPEWLAKVPADKQGSDPDEQMILKNLRLQFLLNNGFSQEKAEKIASEPPPRPAGRMPETPVLDLTQLVIPMIAINGEYDRPMFKTHRMWRELKHFTNVVLPGKSHLSAVSPSYIPPQYIKSMTRFIDGVDSP